VLSLPQRAALVIMQDMNKPRTPRKNSALPWHGIARTRSRNCELFAIIVRAMLLCYVHVKQQIDQENKNRRAGAHHARSTWQRKRHGREVRNRNNL